MQTLYKIKVGRFMLADIYDLMEAEKVISRLMPCVANEIKMIPLAAEEYKLKVVDGGRSA